MDQNIITLEHLTKRYGNTVALYDLNIDIVRGKIIGLLGPNGCGKTTLIKLLANLLNRYDGTITIDGHQPGIETKSFISYLPDRNYLPDTWDSLKAFAFFKDFYADFNMEKANRLLNRLGIDPHLRFKHMSKGTKEKLQLILVLSRDAKCYLFDEPIAGVDPAARELIFELILENYNKEATVIISTHLIYDVEKILDYAIFLKNGVITRYGEAAQIRKNTDKTLEQLFKEDFRC